MFDIQDIRKKVLIKYPPFGSFLANLPFIEDYTCLYKGKPTAATDGNAIHFHPDFINSLNEKQQIAIFAHEISHVVLKHLERRTGKDPELWNIACDASINGNLKKDGLELVEGMIERDDALLFSEEELYAGVNALEENTDLSIADLYKGFVELQPVINNYFESNMILDKDEKVKNNRLAQLLKVNNLADRMGDLSKLVIK